MKADNVFPNNITDLTYGNHNPPVASLNSVFPYSVFSDYLIVIFGVSFLWKEE